MLLKPLLKNGIQDSEHVFAVQRRYSKQNL